MTNMVPSFDDPAWKQWTPREALKPVFRTFTSEGQSYIEIRPGKSPYCVGKLSNTIAVGQPGFYEFSAEYRATDIASENSSINVLVNWFTEKEELRRDYVDITVELEDGWKRLNKVLEAPEGAVKVKLDLFYKWPIKGSVVWRNPSMVKTAAPFPRHVRIASTHMDRRDTMEEAFAVSLDMLDEAGNNKADIICFTETVLDRGTSLTIEERSEELPGRYTKVVAEKAKQYGMYVIYGIIEKEGELYYNSAVLFDRKGEIQGIYRKTHLTLSESEKGITPGYEYPVFETDFGKIGIMICWDHYFPEGPRILADKGAEVIFVPTAGCAPFQAVSRAIENGVYIVTSGTHGDVPSKVINPRGNVISELKGGQDGICYADLDLNEKFYVRWLSVGPAYGEPHSVYMRQTRKETYTQLVKG